MALNVLRPTQPSGEHDVVPPDCPWPTVGTAPFEATPGIWRDELAKRLETDLRRHSMRPWFPRCVDSERGGFLCDFDARWRPDGRQQRMLEFQARQTRTAARFGLAYPNEPHWSEYALHGLRYLRDVMWDRQQGGLYWLVDADGTPQADATKHAHSTAYVLSACADVFRLTGRDEALELAASTFDWLEKHLHDDRNGGYFGWASRDGKPILDPSHSGEPLGHAAGLKDANVHSDLLDALTVLAALLPDQGIAPRLDETYELLTTKFATSAGSMHYLLNPDLSAVPTVEYFGYPFQTAFRLPPAALAIGRPVGPAFDLARLLVGHATALGWDEERGGVIEAGPAAQPFVLSGVALRVPNRSWWVQTEALKAWLLLGLAEGGDSAWLAWFERELDVIDREFIDHRHGGWFPVARSDLPRFGRQLGRSLRKGHAWKDASHEADFYLSSIQMLRGIPPSQRLDVDPAAAA